MKRAHLKGYELLQLCDIFENAEVWTWWKDLELGSQGVKRAEHGGFRGQ